VQSLVLDHPPIGEARPLQLTTYLLRPQTQKTVHGQITILPSRSLLVDFREGERRRGKGGDEVLVIDPSGLEVSFDRYSMYMLSNGSVVFYKVKVYSAPHLSTPCCLAEASAVYSIEKLPSAYWKQYNEAGRLIERLKQRTPKVRAYSWPKISPSQDNAMHYPKWLIARHVSRRSEVHTYEQRTESRYRTSVSRRLCVLSETE